MWLLNARSRQLEYFNDAAAVSQGYAILSHVWSKEEVTYQDLTCLELAKSKKGYCKLDSTCRRALDDGFAYIWMDTCCIDKTSSAELSEAINSMFDWYKRSTICYVYLEDISILVGSSVQGSKWFTRGWTLQELIAPSRMNFYDRDWNLLGNKHELCCELEHYTGIPELILQDCGQLNTASVAKKMSWASQRQTTRSEDMSYCLLGIFDVNMPLLYGEGQKAFYRLQEAIMRRTTDHSILVWTPSSVSTGQGTGLLAAHPADYSDSGRVMHYSVRVPDAYELNNVGIRMSMPVFSEHNKHYILLGCRYEDDFSGTIGLEVEPFGSPKTNSDGLLIMQRRSGTRLFAEAYSTVMIQRSQILLVSSDFEHRKDTAKRNHGLKVWLQRDIRCSSMLRVAETWPKDRWNSGSHVFSWSGPVVPSSGARKGFILILPDEFKAKHFWKLPFGNPTLLLSFVNRLSVSTESRQECLFKATVFDRWPSTAEIAISDQSVDQSWTNVDDSDEDVEHILLVAQVFEVEVKVTVTRQVLMSTPVYILRVARDAPV